MKCAMCGRPILHAAIMAGDYAFGPKCAKKLKGVKPRRQAIIGRMPPPADTRTLPLFGDGDAVTK